MISLEAVHTAFPEFPNLHWIASSGQKHVFTTDSAQGVVVLKLIKSSPSSSFRAEREAEAVARLKCSYIPEIVSVGERMVGGEETIFFVERFVEGRTYRVALQSGRQSIGDVLDLANALLSAIVQFEAASLVHRDIKPENIMIGIGGEIWVLDFGIVRILDLDSLTKTSDKFGPFTPGYGAPEQIRNQKDHIDSRADLFSVGVIIFEALSGDNPYLTGKRDGLAVIQHMLNLDLPRLNLGFAGGNLLGDLVACLVSRFPGRRPASAAEAMDWFLEVRARIAV